jgi:predicted thioesterase
MMARDGRFYTVRVTAWDDVQEIGRGTVQRAMVSMERFMEKMKGRTQGAVSDKLPSK